MCYCEVMLATLVLMAGAQAAPGKHQQVQVNVVMARVDRSKLEQAEAALREEWAEAHGQDKGASFRLIKDPSKYFRCLQGLRRAGLVKLLAEPCLLTLSGRAATLVSGGDQPLPTGGPSNDSTQFQRLGTQLTCLPVVQDDQKIYLEIEAEISEQDSSVTDNSALPGRRVQRLRTSVEMEDGQTFVIGGLIQNTVNGTPTKIPVLGDIPFLGAAFTSTSFDEVEEELVVLVTPHLVDAMSCDQLPPLLPGQETRTPDDFERFLEGILEAPRGPRNVFPRSRYTPAFKNGPTAVFPCAAEGGHCCEKGGCAAEACPGVVPSLSGLPGHRTPVVSQEGSHAEPAASHLPQPETLPLLPLPPE